MTKRKNNSPTVLLDMMPSDVEAIPRWFGILTDEQFDRVCCGSIVSVIVDGMVDGVSVPLSTVRTLIVAMRDRYRRMNFGYAGTKRIDYAKLLGRPERVIPDGKLKEAIKGKGIVITGAGGSIGSEIALICALNNPERLILIERSECALFEVHRKIIELSPGVNVRACLHDVTRADDTMRLFDGFGHDVDIVFHASAYKHVPMLEAHPTEAIRNNVGGTVSVLQASSQFAIEAGRVILVSTDKAASPSSVMGATKKIAEWLIRERWDRPGPYCSFVRFGNVLGSSGSVLDIWEKQLMDGQKPTITDRKMTRYFMTIPEAAAMVIRTSTMDEGGYVLDMGKPINIERLCKRFISEMVRLKRIPRIPQTVTVGAREGEKRHEILVDEGKLVPSGTQWIDRLKLPPLDNMAKVLAGQWNRGLKPEKTYAETEQAIEKMIEKKLRIMAA